MRSGEIFHICGLQLTSVRVQVSRPTLTAILWISVFWQSLPLYTSSLHKVRRRKCDALFILKSFKMKRGRGDKRTMQWGTNVAMYLLILPTSILSTTPSMSPCSMSSYGVNVPTCHTQYLLPIVNFTRTLFQCCQCVVWLYLRSSASTLLKSMLNLKIFVFKRQWFIIQECLKEPEYHFTSC